MNTPLLDINLSTQYEQKKTRKASRGNLPLYAGTIIAGAIILVGSIYAYVTWQQHILERKQSSYSQLKDGRREAEQLIETNKKLSERKQFLDTYLENKVAWAERWKRLSLVIPDEVFLTEITVTSPDPKGDRARVLLKGRALGAAGENLVLRFLDSLKNTTCFSNAFSSIILYSIATERNEKTFTIEMSK